MDLPVPLFSSRDPRGNTDLLPLHNASIVDAIPILVNNAEGTQDIECIIDPPLDILEVHA